MTTLLAGSTAPRLRGARPIRPQRGTVQHLLEPISFGDATTIDFGVPVLVADWEKVEEVSTIFNLKVIG
jgi:hypothetical protein